jgi:hypothetical protein
LTNALEEALKLVLAGKRGKPCKAVIHIPFEELLALPGASAMMAAYTGHAAASAATGGGDGGTWLAGDQAIAILPDAIIVPVVMTRLAAEHMETISSIGAELHRLAAEDQADAQAQAQAADAPAAGHDAPPAGPATAGTDAAAQAERDTRAQRMTDLRHQLAGEVIASVSGPDAVAAWLRRGLLGTHGTGPLSLARAGKSLPLDVGHSRTIPPQIRLAAAIRSPHCQAPGCTQPALGCEAHHLIHREDGGPTSLENCDTYCWWHHQVLIHRMGWTARLNGDGTTTLRRPDGTILPNGPPTWPR